MKEKIRSIAYDVGFDLVSFVAGHLDYKTILEYSDWLTSSFYGEMHYLSNYGMKKFYPELIEPWVKSIIVVGASYFNSSLVSLPSEEYGRVAMYAWGEDYHIVLKLMLEDFVRKLKSEIKKEFSYRIFSDATPLYEKGFALRGGMGFQGKNTCIINPKIGSFFFIGEVLTDLEIEEDKSLGFRGCGKCSLCIDSCPTDALTPYVLNANRCISYLTIEYKGIISEELALKIGDWIFGCDICQLVCPFNKILYVNKLNSKIERFYRNIKPFLNLKEVMKIPSNNQFRKIFKNKAILRAGRRGLIRNAIIVAVNNKAKSLKDDIAKLIYDKDEVIAKTAKWALDRLF